MYETIMKPSQADTDQEYKLFLRRHRNQNNIRIHFLSWMLAVMVGVYSIITFNFFDALYAVPIVVLGTFAGHFFCEGDSMSFTSPTASLKCHILLINLIM